MKPYNIIMFIIKHSKVMLSVNISVQASNIKPSKSFLIAVYIYVIYVIKCPTFLFKPGAVM